ncbi:replication initiator [Nonomuraea sp. NPDC052265]|uniref:replication initiator n=1 Tax=Nonomuraea sp. NPDC052265 TaxID=3364374 RepID=UPI0037CBAEAB
MRGNGRRRSNRRAPSRPTRSHGPAPQGRSHGRKSPEELSGPFVHPWATRHGAGHADHADACFRLHGERYTLDSRTGEVLDVYRTADEPTGFLLTACGNRRASRRPACSAV